MLSFGFLEWALGSAQENNVKVNRIQCLVCNVPEEETRRWLHQRSLEGWNNNDLRPEDVDWIMEKEHYETSLLKWKPDAYMSGQSPATGGTWYIKQGNIIVLGELVSWAHDQMTMFHIYQMWISLPIFARRRKHSESQSENATKTRNAKKLKYQETGRYGLNERGRVQRGP